jgi:hypothetical protein
LLQANICRSPASSTRLAAHGGLDTLLRALRNHTKSAGVTEQACLAVANVALGNPDLSSRLVVRLCFDLSFFFSIQLYPYDYFF